MSTANTRISLTRWLIAVGYVASIFALAPVVLPLWYWLTRQLSTEGAVNTVNTAVPVVGAIIVGAILVIVRRRRAAAYAWLLMTVSGYGYLITLHCEYPVERVHVLQYSVLAWVLYRAFRTNAPGNASMICAAFAAFVVGAVDEALQQFVPDRSTSVADMLTNWTAGGLGLVGLLSFHPRGLWAWYGRRTAFARLCLGYVAPLAVCLALSHQVWTRYLHPPLNLLIITVDCARPDRMSAYGYKRNTTHFLDAMLDNSAVFTNAFSQAAWTGPGVLSTLTGLYPPTHGVTASGTTVPKTVYTLLDAFKERGYRVPNMSYLTVDPNFKNLADMEETGIDVSTIDEVGALREWIGRHHRDPFAIWYHWRFAHLPYDPPTRHRKFPPADDPDADVPQIIREIVQKEVIIPYGTIEFTEEHKPWIDALYDAQIRQFDHALESIRYRLALHHKLNNTILIITADHGEELLDHGHIGHASTAVHSRHFDEHLHIPLIIHCPRRIRKKIVIDTLVQQVDILPTVFDLMGWPVPEEVQGRSLLRAIEGRPMEDVPVFAESIEGGYQSKREMRFDFLRSVRTRAWKLISRISPQQQTFTLFDLTTDPGETQNVYEENPGIAKELTDILVSWYEQTQAAREIIEAREKEESLEAEALDPRNLEVPVILEPRDGETLYYDTNDGAIHTRWTGNPRAAYIIEYDVGKGWHRLRGEYSVKRGTEQIFGPLPQDGWKPLYQWNPYRIRIRPRGRLDGWSEWITIEVAALK